MFTMPVRIRTTEGPVATLIDQLRGWADERAELLGRVAEIDAKVAQVASAMGVEVAPVAVNPGARPGLYDFRRKGAMIEAALEFLDAASNGLTRVELKNKLAEHPTHGEKVRMNANGYYNMLTRARTRGEIVEHGGRLFTPGKVPTEDQPDMGAFDFTGGRPV